MEQMKITRELAVILDKRFQQEVVDDLCRVTKNWSAWMNQPEELIRRKIEFLTSTAFGSMYWNHQSYMIALFGAITPSSALEDFCYHLDREVPSIKRFFESNHGLRLFVGKWTITEREHSSFAASIPVGTVVKITDMSDRGYTIQTESGICISEIGFEV